MFTREPAAVCTFPCTVSLYARQMVRSQETPLLADPWPCCPPFHPNSFSGLNSNRSILAVAAATNNFFRAVPPHFLLYFLRVHRPLAPIFGTSDPTILSTVSFCRYAASCIPPIFSTTNWLGTCRKISVTYSLSLLLSPEAIFFPFPCHFPYISAPTLRLPPALHPSTFSSSSTAESRRADPIKPFCAFVADQIAPPAARWAKTFYFLLLVAISRPCAYSANPKCP